MLLPKLLLTHPPTPHLPEHQKHYQCICASVHLCICACSLQAEVPASSTMQTPHYQVGDHKAEQRVSLTVPVDVMLMSSSHHFSPRPDKELLSIQCLQVWLLYVTHDLNNCQSPSLPVSLWKAEQAGKALKAGSMNSLDRNSRAPSETPNIQLIMEKSCLLVCCHS